MPFRFEHDQQHRSYDAEYANRFWRTLLQADRVLKEFRARFSGKCSPVHFFWGSFDLAVTRFSGRPAPEHPGGVPHLPDWIAREAYSHEVSSCGFWPGNEALLPYAAFYAYAYPEPAGFDKATDSPRCCVLPFRSARVRSALRPSAGSVVSPTPCCSNSCRALMKLPPIWASGIVRHWNRFLSLCSSLVGFATQAIGLAIAQSLFLQDY